MSIVDLRCGDCALLMAELPADSIDLTVTSPPYDNLRKYNGYVFDFEAIARQLYRVTKQGGVVVWVVGDATINGSETGTSFRQALYFKECGFNLHDTMIYKKPGGGAVGSVNAYWQAFEYMFVLAKGKPATINLLKDKKNGRVGALATSGKKSIERGTRLQPIGGKVVQEYGYRENVWEILPGNNGDDATDHPAPFPEALARDHILSWSNPGDTVLDPMCGSGTTGKMAVKLQRNFIGYDISAEYIEISRKRIADAQVQMMMLL